MISLKLSYFPLCIPVQVERDDKVKSLSDSLRLSSLSCLSTADVHVIARNIRRRRDERATTKKNQQKRRRRPFLRAFDLFSAPKSSQRMTHAVTVRCPSEVMSSKRSLRRLFSFPFTKRFWILDPKIQKGNGRW